MTLEKRKKRAKLAKRNNNIRRAILKYTESPKRKVEKKILTIEEQNAKFAKVFPNYKEAI
mgnify:CR=1 FL=1|tara:strand:+ start:44 stop:223 length:180 start_codon:yes stop_codon:yes gene_type:complete